MKRRLFHVEALARANKRTTVEEVEAYLEDTRTEVGWVGPDPGDFEIMFPPGVAIPEREVAISSALVESTEHAPVLDIDIPARLVPSKTPGHSHLFFDVPLSWERYVTLMEALAAAGILETGYVQASVARGQSFVRYAPASKPPPEGHYEMPPRCPHGAHKMLCPICGVVPF
jgi:hypothetical protein